MSKDAPRTAETPEGRQHAEEADALREELSANLAEEVAAYPTKDFRGAVNLTFAQVWELLGYANYEQYLQVLTEEEGREE